MQVWLISRWSDILLALIIFAVAFLLFLPLVPYLLKANVDADDKVAVIIFSVLSKVYRDWNSSCGVI